MDAQQATIGWWPGDPNYGQAAFTPTRIRPRMGFRTPTWPLRPRAGTASSASSCSTGTRSAGASIHMRSRSSSRTQRSATPACCANGIPSETRIRPRPSLATSVWYRFGTDRYVRCVQIVQKRGRIGRSGRSRTYLRPGAVGWGPKGREFKSRRPDCPEAGS
jgi:hypothetical protein